MNNLFKLSTWLPTLLSDLRNPYMITSLLVIVIVNVIIRLRVPTDSPQMDGLNEANLGLLIAYLAHLDLVFAAFWSILLFAKGRPALFLLPF